MCEKKLNLLVESQLEKAEIVFAIQNVVDEMQTIAEKLSKMKVETISPLIERMKAEFGINTATNFNEKVGDYLHSALEAVLSSKNSIDNEKLRISGDASDLDDEVEVKEEPVSNDIDTIKDVSIKEEPHKIKVESKQYNINEGNVSDKFKVNYKVKQLKNLVRKLDTMDSDTVNQILSNIDLTALPNEIKSMIMEAKKRCKKSKENISESIAKPKSYKLMVESINGNTITKKFKDLPSMKCWIRENNSKISSIRHL